LHVIAIPAGPDTVREYPEDTIDSIIHHMVRRLVRLAEKHGYTRGDMCTGGAYFLSRNVLVSMLKNGFLDLQVLSRSTLIDDTLMGLLCGAAGYRLSDLPEDRDILAINWRGLPMPIEALVSQKKKIVHPIKDDDPAMEAHVRAHFRKRRAVAAARLYTEPTATTARTTSSG
jgi:hypothetical protein